jgi:hypothetical protein
LESKLIQLALCLFESTRCSSVRRKRRGVAERIAVAGAAQHVAAGSPRSVLPGVMHQSKRATRNAALPRVSPRPVPGQKSTKSPAAAINRGAARERPTLTSPARRVAKKAGLLRPQGPPRSGRPRRRKRRRPGRKTSQSRGPEIMKVKSSTNQFEMQDPTKQHLRRHSPSRSLLRAFG